MLSSILRKNSILSQNVECGKTLLSSSLGKKFNCNPEVRLMAATESGPMWAIQVRSERGTHWKEGVCHDRYATQCALNKVEAKSNVTPLVQPSGADFPHIVGLDFAQDKTLGGDAVGWSQPTAMSIQHSWTMDHCPVLLDSDACVPMPFLISVKALEQTSPGLVIDPISK